MPVTQTITFSATPPTIGETPTLFNTHAVAVWNELKNTTVPNLNTAFGQLNTLETNVNTKEASTVQAAADAQAAMATTIAASGATKWISGTAYLAGVVVWSPITGTSYRAIVNTSGTTDPSLDTANWFNLQPSPNLAVLKIQSQLNYGGF